MVLAHRRRIDAWVGRLGWVGRLSIAAAVSGDGKRVQVSRSGARQRDDGQSRDAIRLFRTACRIGTAATASCHRPATGSFRSVRCRARSPTDASPGNASADRRTR